MMDYTQLLNQIKHASAFDLYRLHVAIGHELDNPQRISKLKQKLRIGMDISYFDYVKNRLIKSKLLEMKPKTAKVLDLEQNRPFSVPYYMLNADNIAAEIYETKNTEPLTANTLKVGDIVGFNKDGESIVGIVVRLNYKTVTLRTKGGNKWRVSYSLLYRVYDAELDFLSLP